MCTKYQIAKFLIVFGFMLSIANYGAGLIHFYTCEDQMSIVLEETGENSEKKEKEKSEKEDLQEKDKISQYFVQNQSGLNDLYNSLYPVFYAHNTSVYLEQNTPPPEFS